MYTQKITCPACGRRISAYRPEVYPSEGNYLLRDAHAAGQNAGYLTPYRHKTGANGGPCHGSLNRYVMPYRPITQESCEGLYMGSWKHISQSRNPIRWMRYQVGLRMIINGNRKD